MPRYVQQYGAIHHQMVGLTTATTSNNSGRGEKRKRAKNCGYRVPRERLEESLLFARPAGIIIVGGSGTPTHLKRDPG